MAENLICNIQWNILIFFPRSVQRSFSTILSSSSKPFQQCLQQSLNEYRYGQGFKSLPMATEDIYQLNYTVQCYKVEFRSLVDSRDPNATFMNANETLGASQWGIFASWTSLLFSYCDWFGALCRICLSFTLFINQGKHIKATLINSYCHYGACMMWHCSFMVETWTARPRQTSNISHTRRVTFRFGKLMRLILEVWPRCFHGICFAMFCWR